MGSASFIRPRRLGDLGSLPFAFSFNLLEEEEEARPVKELVDCDLMSSAIPLPKKCAKTSLCCIRYRNRASVVSSPFLGFFWRIESNFFFCISRADAYALISLLFVTSTVPISSPSGISAPSSTKSSSPSTAPLATTGSLVVDFNEAPDLAALAFLFDLL